MGALQEIISQHPFLSPEPAPLEPLEEIVPAQDNGVIIDQLQEKQRTGQTLLRMPPPGLLTESLVRKSPAIVSSTPEPLNVMDFLSDATEELIAGVVEGATLENVEFGEIGPDTTIGDISRSVGRFGGSVVSYGTIAAVLGHLGVFAGALSAPMIVARAGTTAFLARMLTDIDDGEEDMLDRVQNSIQSGAIGAAVATVPFVFDKAMLAAHGGPSKFMDTVKTRLSKQLVDKFGFSPDKALQATREFEAEVLRQGGPEKLSGTMMKRLAKGELNAKRFLQMQRGVHAIAKGRRGLNLSEEEFYKINIARTGEAHTNRMGVNELRELRKFYADMLRNRATNAGGTEDFLTLARQSTGFEPGYFSFNRPVERVMRQMGFQNLYDRVYDAKIESLNEQTGFDQVRRILMKGLNKTQKKAIFQMMDNTVIPVNTEAGVPLTDTDIYSLYLRAAKGFGVDLKGVRAATWIRYTSRALLNRMNSELLAQGMEPVVERGAYITHLLEDTGKGLGGITPEIWAALKYGKQGGSVSRFLKQRLGAGDVLEDPFRAHAMYVRAALKMIHLGPAKRSVLQSINSKVTLKNGKVVKLELPENTYKFIDDWLNHGVMEVTTDTDKLLNTTLGMSAKALTARVKMAGYRGTLWGNPVSVLRNTTQQTLNIARLGRYWIEGIHSFNPRYEFLEGLNGWQFAEKYCKLLQGRAPALEGLDPTSIGKLTQVGFAPFRAVDKANIVAGFNGAVKKHLAEGKSFPQAVKLADRLVRDTQFNYLNIDQPLFWLSSPGRLASQFHSWWTRYLEEIWSWGGTMPIGDGSGRTMKIAKHAFNVAKSREMARYLTVNLTLLYGLHRAGLPLKTLSVPVPFVSNGPMPTGIPPAMDGLLGMGETSYGTLIGNSRIQQSGLSRVIRQLPTHTIPGYSTVRKIARIEKGKLPLESLFFPISEKDYKKQQESWFK